MPNEDDEMTPEQAKAEALRRRDEAQARWRVISPLVSSLREIRKANHLAERFERALMWRGSDGSRW